ncbi:MAG: thermostable hemolysin [Magnetospirillum sp.]|nr:thermostable hemolysin [Magnetospirillum sp.]
MTVILADRDHPARTRLEHAVRSVFLAEYGAHVSAFPNRMIATMDETGQPLAVAGLRFADDGLFSEVYLDGPAEQVLGQALGRTVQRRQIVEFSSLAAPRPGAAMPLVAAAIRLCLASGSNFGMFTATARLRALLRRTGLMTVDLGPAQPGRLTGAAAWGSYYLHDPRVLVVAGETLPCALAPDAAVPERRHA